MAKKQPTNVPLKDMQGRAAASRGRKHLKIGQIRDLAAEIRALPEGAVLPDWTDLSLGGRFAVALQLLSTEQRESLGKSAKQLTRYSAGTEIPVMVLAALGANTELPIDWLITGRPMERKPPMVRLTPGTPIAAVADVPIQKLAFRASAGPGSLVIDDNAEYERIPRRVLERSGIKAQNARLLEVSGISMAPTMDDRDTVLVDVSSTDIVEGKVYVFSIGDNIHVKRLRRAGGKVMMMSDNRELFPNDEAVPAEQSFRIHARVDSVWKKL